jgi:hypothetical protein
MMTKLTYSDVAAELRETSQVSLQTKGSYAYATGMYESILASLVVDLPKHKQLEVIRSLQSAREHMQKNA